MLKFSEDFSQEKQLNQLSLFLISMIEQYSVSKEYIDTELLIPDVKKMFTILKIDETNAPIYAANSSSGMHRLQYRMFKFYVFLCKLDNNFVKKISVLPILKDLLELSNTKDNFCPIQIDSVDVINVILEQLPYFIFWKDINGRYLGANKGFAHIAGFESVEELIGHHDIELGWKPRETEHFISYDQKVMTSGVPEINIIEPQLQADGRERYLLTTKIPLKNSVDEIVGVLGIFTDYTTNKEEENQKEQLLKEIKIKNELLKSLAITDDLTQLYNRRYFNETFKSLFSTAQRAKENLGFLMFDIDNFKLYNDNYGHDKGDEILKNVASILKECFCRNNDIVCRMGGEEFGVIVYGLDEMQLLQQAQKASKAIYNANMIHEYNNDISRISISAGVTYCDFAHRFKSTDELYRQADIALYQAKKAGRNCVVKYESKT